MKSNLAFSYKDTAGAYKYIEKARNGYRKYSDSEALIYSFIADFFKHAEKPEIAGQQYRKALELDPDNIEIINKFVDYCFYCNRHYDAALMDKAMKLNKNKQQHSEFLSEKGMCFLMQGEYDKAFDTVQKALEEAPFKIYRLKYYLEEVKKKVLLPE
jgi:Tfp pilus assembly protein PilF